jgi:hypothetical protein
MRLSIMAGWFYSVVRMVRWEAGSHTKWQANRGVARDLDCAKLNVQTLAPVCRYSQNVVKMPVDIGFSISSRVNWVLWALHACTMLVSQLKRSIYIRQLSCPNEF